MKTIIRLPVRLILFLFITALLGCDSNYKNDLEKSKNALTKLIEHVKQEPHFVKIKMHVDPEDSSNILLYEEWEDLTYYRTDHMNTDHLQGFMAASQNFLLGPPDVTFWEVKKVFD